jgi:carbonic anhydrase/acetyltransferase-like protein (isoleucine patch superfamily)
MIRPGEWRVSVDPTAWVADNATLVGQVQVAAHASIWYASVLRGDGDAIHIGPRTNLQDGTIIHADPGFPAVVGAGVSVGHRAILHGCTVEDDVLVGMGAIIMNGAVIGEQSIVAAGALVLEGVRIPPRSLVVGVPGKVVRQLGDEQVAVVRQNAESYVELSGSHRLTESRRRRER